MQAEQRGEMMTEEEAKDRAIKLIEEVLDLARSGELWQVVVVGRAKDGQAAHVFFSPYTDILGQIGLLEYAKQLALQVVEQGGQEKPN